MPRPRGPQAVAIQLTDPQRAILEEMVCCRTRPQYEVMRATIILQAAAEACNQLIADNLQIDAQTVRLWRRRWAHASARLRDIEATGDEKVLRAFIGTVLTDAPRSGRPATFTPEQLCHLVAVACESPEASGRPVSHWTPRELTEEVIKRGLVDRISTRSVGRFLKRSGFKAASVPLLAQP
jgi:putative transposase